MIFWRMGPSTGMRSAKRSMLRRVRSSERDRIHTPAAAASGRPSSRDQQRKNTEGRKRRVGGGGGGEGSRYHQQTKRAEMKSRASVSFGSLGESVLNAEASCG